MMSSDHQLTDNLAVSECSECPRLVDCRSRIVNGVGPVDADVVLIGEAPGANEDEGGEPFVGRSGSILDEALAENNLSRDDIRITNCVRCRPPENRDPRVGELENCRPHLIEELARIDPEVVVTLGRVPTEQLLGDVGKVSDAAGNWYTTSLNGTEYDVLVSVHPAATLYNRSLRPRFDETFETLAGVIE